MHAYAGHSRIWRIRGFVLGLLIMPLLMLCRHTVVHPNHLTLASAPKPSPTLTPNPTASQLQNEKLIQEIRQLELSNRNAASPWRYWVILAPTLAGVAAILTLGLGWWTQLSQSKRQGDQDRAQREAESIREFGSRFASVVSNLGSDSASLQASAASVLALFLDDRYIQFRGHIIRVASANLRLSRSTLVRDLLVDVLGTALRSEYSANPIQSLGDHIDVSSADLHGLNITDARLRDAFFAERADLTQSKLDRSDLWKSDLKHAILTKASLRHANLGQARLDDATLTYARLGGLQATSASLRGVDARYAMFQGSRLQSAHFEGADLRGARFDGANLADCYFFGAKLDIDALKSIVKSQRWRTAHFDPPVRERLLAYASSSSHHTH